MTTPSKLLLVAAAAVVAWIPLAGRSDTPLQSAALAWDRGDYVTALTTYLQALDTADDKAFEEIALQTGELFQTTELTTDGAAPVFAPDGRHILYETGAGVNRRIRIVATADPSNTVADLPGSAGVFSSDGRVAYVKLTPSADLQAAQTALDAAPPTERAQRLAAVNAGIAREAQLTIRTLASGAETTVPTAGLRVASPAFVGATLIFSGAAASRRMPTASHRCIAEPRSRWSSFSCPRRSSTSTRC